MIERKMTMRPTSLLKVQKLLSFLIFCCFLTAQGDWSAAPMRFDIKAQRGDKLTQFFSVSNKKDVAQSFHIYTMDWTIDSKGHMPEYDPGSLSRGATAWFIVTPENFTVEPGASTTVRFTIAVPTDAKSGVNWGAIFIETTEAPTLASRAEAALRSFSVMVKIRVKVDVRILVDGELFYDGEIVGLDAVVDSTQSHLAVLTSFNNTGNTVLKCEGKIEIRDEMGEPVDEFLMESFTCFPENNRNIRTIHSLDLPPGEYSSMVVIDFGGDYLVAGEAYFEIKNP